MYGIEAPENLLFFLLLIAVEKVYFTSYTKFHTIYNYFGMNIVHNIDIYSKEWDKTLFLPARFRH